MSNVAIPKHNHVVIDEHVYEALLDLANIVSVEKSASQELRAAYRNFQSEVAKARFYNSISPNHHMDASHD